LPVSKGCLLASIIAGTLAAGPADALPLTFVRAGANASVDFGSPQNNDTGVLTRGLAIEDASSVGRSASGSSPFGSSAAIAHRGNLGAKAEVESVLAVGPDARAEATAGALASFADQITFLAPPGSHTVRVRFVLNLDGTIDDACGLQAC